MLTVTFCNKIHKRMPACFSKVHLSLPRVMLTLEIRKTTFFEIYFLQKLRFLHLINVGLLFLDEL